MSYIISVPVYVILILLTAGITYKLQQRNSFIIKRHATYAQMFTLKSIRFLFGSFLCQYMSLSKKFSNHIELGYYDRIFKLILRYASSGIDSPIEELVQTVLIFSSFFVWIIKYLFTSFLCVIYPGNTSFQNQIFCFIFYKILTIVLNSS